MSLFLLDSSRHSATPQSTLKTLVVALAESEGEIVHYAAAVGKHAEWILDRRGASASSGLCGTSPLTDIHGRGECDRIRRAKISRACVSRPPLNLKMKITRFKSVAVSVTTVSILVGVAIALLHFQQKVMEWKNWSNVLFSERHRLPRNKARNCCL